MPTIKYSWDLDYNPDSNNPTGHNLFLKTLPKLEEWGSPHFKTEVYETLLEFAGHEFMKDS